MAEFSTVSLRLLAGDQAYRRGERYVADGRVRILQRDVHAVDGEVAGTHIYQSRLSWKDGHLSFACSCPVGDAGECCKHVVALGLAAEQSTDARSGKNKAESDGLVAFLQGQPAAWLAETLLSLANEYPELRRRLQVQQQLAGDVNPAILKKSVSAILGHPRFLDYRQSREYARKLQELGGLFRQLLVSGNAKTCVMLGEYALERLFNIYGQSDDSSGAIGGEIHYIAGLYLEACGQSAVGDAAFPRRLFKLMLADDWNIIRIEDFMEILGDDGVSEWESALEAAWTIAAAEPDRHDEFNAKTSRLRYLMESLAEKRGDVDLLIRLLGHDLRYPYHYNRVIDVCRDHGRQREAVQWAERGIKAFPRDVGLRAVLAGLYLNDGLDTEALELLWRNFFEHVSPEHYLALKHASGQDWPAWRTRAHEAMQTSERKYFERNNTRFPRAVAPDGTARIRCLLAEGALDEAREVVGRLECSHYIRIELARRIADTHPEAAAAHFCSAIPHIVSVGSNNAYAEAAELLREMRPWLQGEAYHEYIAALRLQFKAKRNFIKLLDGLSSTS